MYLMYGVDEFLLFFSFYANVFLDVMEIKEKWYFEFHWKSDSTVSKSHLRVGYALFHMFNPKPSM